MCRNIIKWFLLLLTAAAIITQTVKSFLPIEEAAFNNGKHLVFFHAKVRCPTCYEMERMIKKTLDTDFKNDLQSGIFDFSILDYESPESKRIVEEYKIATAAVLLFEKKDEEYGYGRNLAEQCWKLVGDEPAFQKMLKTEVEYFIKGKNPVLENKTEEIELEPGLNLFGNEEGIIIQRGNENDQ